MVLKLLLIFLGGGVGACLRFGISLGVRALVAGRDPAPQDESTLALIPLATLGVNLLGCFLIGVLMPILTNTGAKEETRLLLVVGLLGGFTTFSAFGYETYTLLVEHRVWWAIAYALASVVLGVGAVALGHTLGTRLGA
ncbi:MAG: putative fluoride ion transporter CrcB [Phycisphaeraceae bacterium]|nr:MAG: putative fluoride ion transporter CrcB [Phycisphaeraceae bacterium]